MKTDNILLTALILVFIMGCFKVSVLNTELNNLETERDLIRGRYDEQSEKLLTHIIINQRLNDITDKYQSSRNEKRKNKELLNLMQKVN
jgi:hypothetical protein